MNNSSRVSVSIPDMNVAVAKREFPSITVWNRLEGRPRSKTFDRAFRAEIRDALWMLSKQWQMGEFRGDDAGSPIAAKILIEHSKLTTYQARDAPRKPFPEKIPIEAIVEQRKIHFSIDGQKVALDLRLQLGRQWLKLLEKSGIGKECSDWYILNYPIAIAPPDPTLPADAPICADGGVRTQFAAVTGRAMDGGTFYEKIRSNPATLALEGIADALQLPTESKNTISGLAVQFVRWFESLYLQPQEGEGDAWDPSRLEYQFRCSTSGKDGQKEFIADEYASGHLDWFNLDVNPNRFKPRKKPKPQKAIEGVDLLSFIPTTITFQGMPTTRWWTMEDSRTNFGNIKPNTEDLGKLLVMEFGLIYANDWFLFPFTQPIGSVSTVKGLAVTNVFGERFWIESAGKGLDDDWQRWSMFNACVKGQMNEKADLSLVLLPGVASIQESSPLEDVVFIRDEIANMVWGIETTISMPDGRSKRGSEASIGLFKYLQAQVDRKNATNPPNVEPPQYRASIRYQVMNSVPENWIPFIPVHVKNSNREIQLQRSSMPRILKGGSKPPDIVHPRTQLLNQGRDSKSSYFIYEEEVPRAGCQVSLSFQRTRGPDGRVIIWLGIRKGTGRGESSSGLAFDQIVPTS